MGVSGSTDFNVTRDDIIDGAAYLLGVKAESVELSGSAQIRFAQALNMLVKRWQAMGLHVWTESEAILFPQPSQEQYAIGGTSTDHCAATSFIQNTLSVAANVSATSVSVASTTGIAVNDKIGIQLDNATIQWTTVNGKTATSLSLAVVGGLTDSAALGNYIFTYTADIVRPLRIVGARRYNVVSLIETPLVPSLSRLDYMALPNKKQNGSINQYFYDPQLVTGQLYIWNPIAVVDTLLKFTYWRPIDDFDAASDNPDLPQEWIDTLIYNLAMVMAPMFSVPMDKFTQIKLLADQFLGDLKEWDREVQSIYFAPDSN